MMKGNDRVDRLNSSERKRELQFHRLRLTESQSGDANNVDAEPHQDGFMMNLSQDRKSQYGSQFEANGNEGPGIVGKWLLISLIFTLIFNPCLNLREIAA